MRQRILVTGGSSFIGSHVVDKLSGAGHQPCIFDMVLSPFHDETIDTYVGERSDLQALRTGDFRGAEVSGARAAHELGWTAQTRFAAGAERYVSWYRSQHPELDPVAT